MTTRWGIIGCGDVCEVKSGPALQKVRGSALAAVMRRDGAKAEDFARRHGVARWTDDADAIIHGDDVDAVYVATPPDSHETYALRAAAAGKPCYVEKPMARNTAECGRMVEAFERAGVPLFVAYYRRCLPRFVRVKQLLDAGAIGTVTSASLHFAGPFHRQDSFDAWRLDPAIAGAGLFLDLASHALDLLDHLLGPIVEVGGVASNRATPIKAEDTVAMHFQHDTGVVGTGLWNFASTVPVDRLTLDGTDGRIACSIFGTDDVVLTRNGRDPDFDAVFDAPMKLGGAVLTRDGDNVSFDGTNPPHVHQPLVQTMVDELHGQGACPSTGRSATRTNRVMDAVLASYYGDRADGFWTRMVGESPSRS